MSVRPRFPLPVVCMQCLSQLMSFVHSQVLHHASYQPVDFVRVGAVVPLLHSFRLRDPVCQGHDPFHGTCGTLCRPSIVVSTLAARCFLCSRSSLRARPWSSGRWLHQVLQDAQTAQLFLYIVPVFPRSPPPSPGSCILARHTSAEAPRRPPSGMRGASPFLE